MRCPKLQFYGQRWADLCRVARDDPAGYVGLAERLAGILANGATEKEETKVLDAFSITE